MAPPKKKKRAPAKKSKSKSTAAQEVIEIRGAWQNNLKGFDIDLPLNTLTVVTGPSGSGKSSFAFQTVYAEGQRRYVETFSPYTRQFFERMDKPQVDEIRGIPPAIAIEQVNLVRSTRSTVGTITEINDYLKLLFPRLARGYCPDTGEEVEPDSPESITVKAREAFKDQPVLITFGVPVPEKTKPETFFEFLQQQGYLRVLLFKKIYRTDDPDSYQRKTLPAIVDVIQDRVAPMRKGRFLEAVEAALSFGKGRLTLVEPEKMRRLSFSRGWHCPASDRELRPPTPALFSFNHPLGACPVCRGFGRTIAIDLDQAIPDKRLSIAGGVVKAFQGVRYSECQLDLERCALRRKLSLDLPFREMSKRDQDWILYGEKGDPEENWNRGDWYGLKGFFDWVEKKSYKMHVRIFLSRFRCYTRCPSCRGGRLQPEALNYRMADRTLPELWQLPVDELLPIIEGLTLPPRDPTTEMVWKEVVTRLSYLKRVGLSYLNLDRSTRSLSGGELQRVNLTTCLGASLVGTLFVLDEPSIGLHPRDTHRLIQIMQGLRDKGNTLLVVEHEEAVIRAADHLVDIGPGSGEQGGELVFAGDPKALLKKQRTASQAFGLTGRYLRGEEVIPVPKKRRKPKRGDHLRLVGAAQNNLQNIDVDIPLGVFTCVTGVSGSGKSTLVHDVLYQNLLRAKGQPTTEEVGDLGALKGFDKIDEVIMVDQSPLSRTPRSTPAVFTGAFEGIRKLFAETPDARSRALTMGYFSFNSGGGRCERCWGNGFEKIEMQFLSDIFVRCPECEGARYQKEVLEIHLDGKSISDVLQMSVREAIAFFSRFDDRKAKRIVDHSLTILEEVGLGYLRLGQPLNTLSGGESQRLKLVGHLVEHRRTPGKKSPLLIFDEPTTGLHFHDVAQLIRVFQKLAEQGKSLLVVEHHLDVIKCADHVIDLGPEGGVEGGQLVVAGTPEAVARCPESHTGAFLKPLLGMKSAALKVAETEEAKAFRRTLKADNDTITIRGAREHNLKNIDVSIPREKMVVVTGLSGSGKSTLAFDILFAEGQRRFLDSMSPYARQFAEQLEKPDIDHVSGLPPTVAIEQRISRGGGKSTVATVTEVYHFLRLLFAKAGTQYSPDSGLPVEVQSISSITTRLRKAAKHGPVRLLAP
ncbi:MAG: excinuclease ABC subunit UvrA, partial [Verrucomicrobiota bacterium]